jgi:hypothetical protein
MKANHRWIPAIAMCCLIAVLSAVQDPWASGVCERPGVCNEILGVLRLSPGRLQAPLASRRPAAAADPVPSKPKNPIPVDVGKGIEAKLDQLLDAIKSLTLDALKAAYFQGVLHGALTTALLFTIIIAFTRRGAP